MLDAGPLPVVLTAALLFAPPSAAREPVGAPPAKPRASTPLALGATVSCRAEPGTGRLLCAVELAAPPRHAITWSDAVVVSAPPAARPLKSRVPGSGRPPLRVVLGFVLGTGEGGRIEFLARAVVCPEPARPNATCTPLSRRLSFAFERTGG